ncbi:hypothetical protein F5Y12DRAFT_787666 [Xylaria sp. FL1777]|nr:hypothetical protein F5Y12DRAFT_787666 [Xylaria sp. FL1777]
MSSSGHDDEPSPEERLSRNPVVVGASASTSTRRVKKKRVRNFTEDDRAAHRIFEKSRREAFKEALTNLASLLPALADTEPQRLSKHVVVDESITFIRAQHEQIRTISDHLETVKAERAELLAELNHWRGGAGIEPRQANTMTQPTIHHSDASTASEAVLGAVPAVPAVLQPTDSPMHIIGEAASFTSPIHESNPPPSLSAESNASMHWESFEPQIHPFASHVQGDNGPTNMGGADPVQLSTYQPPQSPIISQFNIDQGQHGTVFLPFEPHQSFNQGGFQADTFMANAVPLQDYIPP